MTPESPGVATGKPPLLLIELNEFSDALLRSAARDLGLRNIQKIFELSYCEAKTDDEPASDLLEPWVQWVSIHTGKPASVHGVKHLGDVLSLKFPQVWETLSKASVTTGVWGVLNGSRGSHNQHNQFFLPDPWTFTESAYPEALAPLLDLPRYAATHRLRRRGPVMLKHVSRFARVLWQHSLLQPLAEEIPGLVQTATKYRGAFVGYCLVEYLSGLLFLQYWRRYQPQFGVLFLNSLAHLQHYYWFGPDYARNEKLAYGLRLIDKLLARTFTSLRPGTRLVVCNGLSQKNTNDEPEWVSYRPKDHAVFLKAVGIAFKSVAPLMSYDAWIFFASTAEKISALQKLQSARVGSEKLFLVEEFSTDPLKLFYRFQFTAPVANNARCAVGGVEFEFGTFFKKLVTRTGRHVPRCDIYSNDVNMPPRMNNHELAQYILDHFAVGGFDSAV